MTRRAQLEAALPPGAQAFLSKQIDPADAWLAWKNRLTIGQAHSRARNFARQLGSSWPDCLPSSSLMDPAEITEIQHLCGLHGLSPLEILEAVEAAETALAAPDAAPRLAQADAQEVDTRELGKACNITRRRAQQIKKSMVDLAARQLPLFTHVEWGVE